MIDAEDDRAEIADPGLVARRVAGDVEWRGPARSGFTISGTILFATLLRRLRRNAIARERIAHRNAVHQARAGGIEDLPSRNRRPRASVPASGAGEQRAEVALLERIDRRRVAEAGQHAGAELQPVQVGEEERLVAPVVDLGNVYRSADRETEGIAALLRRPFAGRKPRAFSLSLAKYS